MTGTNAASVALRVLGHTPHVRRGWPGKNGSITFETRDAGGRLRAGMIDASGDVRLADYGRDKKLPELASSAGELLVHRFGKRAVVRQDDAITKYLRPGKAAAVARMSTDIRAACRQIGLGTAQVSEHTDDSVTFSLLPGRSLHELGDAGRDGWEEFFARWPQWQGLQVDGLPTFSAVDEAVALRTWIGHARHHGVARADELARAADGVVERLLEGCADAGSDYVLLHRDLHDKQLLWDGRVLSVLDLDTAAYGEAALDAGNLLTHVRLREMQGLLSPEFAAELAGRISRLVDSPERLEVYAESAALRLACVYAFRPAAGDWWSRWVERVLG